MKTWNKIWALSSESEAFLHQASWSRTYSYSLSQFLNTPLSELRIGQLVDHLHFDNFKRNKAVNADVLDNEQTGEVKISKNAVGNWQYLGFYEERNRWRLEELLHTKNGGRMDNLDGNEERNAWNWSRVPVNDDEILPFSNVKRMTTSVTCSCYITRVLRDKRVLKESFE